MIQLQALNYILKNRDHDLLMTYGQEYYFNYEAEYNVIKNHYTKYKTVPDVLTVQDKVPTFKVIDTNESKQYIEQKLYEEYVRRCKQDECVAIGEIGLDYYWDKDNKERQKEVFERQLKLAIELDKPVIIHSRDAIADTYELLKKNRCRGVMHCYSDSAEMAREFVKLGYYISISGTLTWKNAKEPLRVI